MPEQHFQGVAGIEGGGTATGSREASVEGGGPVDRTGAGNPQELSFLILLLPFNLGSKIVVYLI